MTTVLDAHADTDGIVCTPALCGEDRDNDKHLTLAEKRAARGET